MGDNPLIAETESRATLGSGWATDVALIKEDIDEDAKLALAVDFTLVGIDFLLAKANPFGSLIANGVGWLIEHIPGLSDVWDKLTGDPVRIDQISSTWDNIASSLGSSNQRYVTASNEIEQWNGKASDSYRKVATGYSTALAAATNNAQAFSAVVEIVGGGVAGCKDAVYTLISEFIEFTVIPAILGAIATSWCTFGGSIAAAISYIEIQADVTAGQVTVKITEVTEKIILVGERSRKVIAKTVELTEKLEKLEHTLDKGDSFLRKQAKEAAKGTARGEVEGTHTRAKKASEGGEGEGGEGGEGTGEGAGGEGGGTTRTPSEAGAR